METLFVNLSKSERASILREQIKKHEPHFTKVDELVGSFLIYEEVVITLETLLEGLSTFVSEVFVYKGDHYVSHSKMKRLLTEQQFRELTAVCITSVFFENGK